ncbi:MAG: DUF6412 domain-containing protein [Micromonosporaceae bacterium]
MPTILSHPVHNGGVGLADMVTHVVGVVAHVAGAVALVTGFFQVGGGHMPAGLVLFAAAALAGVLARFLMCGRFAPITIPSARAVALRAKSRHTVYLRQRDPRAAGRVRPRAPSAQPTAA